ncbi:MAG: methyltransferase domain-containing protein [Candidatus Krumholzibacteriia bacterium]
MSAWSYARRTLLNPRSRACFWTHPVQASRMVVGAAGNAVLGVGERVARRGPRECPVCRWQGLRFRAYIAPEVVIPACICPRCGSFDRHRHLVLGMREWLAREVKVPGRILGLSLSPAMAYLLAHEGLGRCFRSDLDRTDPRIEIDVVADLTRAGYRDDAFDWVVCSHVLEHIAELAPAVDELRRILAPGGVAWLQMAWNDDLAESHPIAVDPHAIDAHAWRFGRDIDRLLARPGWTVTRVHAGDLAADLRQRHGIHPDERYWVLRRSL